MNAHATPEAIAAAKALSQQRPAQKLILDAGHIVSMIADVTACREAEEADRRADEMEEQARLMDAASVAPANEIDRLLGLELAGDYAWRARLYRARAAELRS